jgi:hypothetical protein
MAQANSSRTLRVLSERTKPNGLREAIISSAPQIKGNKTGTNSK